MTKPASEPLDIEAHEVADQFVRAHFALACGPDVFGKTGDQYWQYRGFHWSLHHEPLAYSDTRAGILWKGHLALAAAQYRTCPQHHGFFGRTGGSAWHPFETLSIYVQKKNGVWNICRPGAEECWPIGDAAPTCDELRRVVPAR
ncbi:MAG: hypothetical protein ACHQ9S_25715 [Candidatus Binatia bacterium]